LDSTNSCSLHKNKFGILFSKFFQQQKSLHCVSICFKVSLNTCTWQRIFVFCINSWDRLRWLYHWPDLSVFYVYLMTLVWYN
jgi:hypothetical protein